MLLWMLACAYNPSAALAADGEEISYDGNFSSDAPTYKKGAPVTISHSGGNISVNCVDTEGLSARIQYAVRGTSQPAMQAFGDGVGMAVFGDSKSGSVKTKVPSRGTGVNSADVVLRVQIPSGTSALTVSQTGAGYVEVFNCAGALKISAGTGGAYASGKYTSVNATASGGNVTIEQDKDTPWTGTSTISAPAGSATVTFASAQMGKLNATAAEVSVQPLVMGTNAASVVTGDIGTGGPSITIKAKDRVDVKNP